MSRIGKKPIILPEGVTCKVEDRIVTVEGPLGTLTRKIESDKIGFEFEGNVLTVTRADDEKQTRALHGLYRALIANMVKGVKEGFTTRIIANGVGYRLQKQGKKLIMNIGYSKPKEIEEIEGITLNVTGDKQEIIEVKGINNELVGQVAAKIRAFRPVEPYHFYGLRYDDEVVIKKVPKKGGKK